MENLSDALSWYFSILSAFGLLEYKIPHKRRFLMQVITMMKFWSNTTMITIMMIYLCGNTTLKLVDEHGNSLGPIFYITTVNWYIVPSIGIQCTIHFYKSELQDLIQDMKCVTYPKHGFRVVNSFCCMSLLGLTALFSMNVWNFPFRSYHDNMDRSAFVALIIFSLSHNFTVLVPAFVTCIPIAFIIFGQQCFKYYFVKLSSIKSPLQLTKYFAYFAYDQLVLESISKKINTLFSPTLLLVSITALQGFAEHFVDITIPNKPNNDGLFLHKYVAALFTCGLLLFLFHSVITLNKLVSKNM